MKLSRRQQTTDNRQRRPFRRRGANHLHRDPWRVRQGAGWTPSRHRALVEALLAKGWHAETLFYADDRRDEIHDYIVDDFDAYVPRVNPGTTLFSGAKYRYDDPGEWPELITMFGDSIDTIASKLGGWSLPLIWTADFMLDDGEDGEDKYVLGEINCSCVGFTSHLDSGIQDVVADEVIRVVEAE